MGNKGFEVFIPSHNVSCKGIVRTFIEDKYISDAPTGTICITFSGKMIP